ncbi:PACE efflux transporter [Desulfoluna spongiiphila]|uniref:PACE efflux transporter n=1 Tax=Desulfoluna spongiiphila TaxID=419481 RepID=UPI0012573217|nr:PACE efflux transporter [Desulfoluna spongiiphila]VVS93686.1 chlorhexidine efflux transporter [Desulfoluna spongiiphila]
MNTTMRTTRDRLRHALLFEITLLMICVPLLSWVMHAPLEKMGALSITMSLMAMAWNYIYNILFDHALLRAGMPLYPRSMALRTAHALLFEAGLMCATIPLVMWWLHLSFYKALMLDLAFLVMVPIYTILYNGLYDRMFPVGGLPADRKGMEGKPAGAGN